MLNALWQRLVAAGISLFEEEPDVGAVDQRRRFEVEDEPLYL
ncbi:MAG: hypothetical protein ABIP71_06180 [Verrucomicrobiota bacterium]